MTNESLYPEPITDDCVCGTPHKLCPGCEQPRCYQCIPYGTDTCDMAGPPAAEAVPA